MNFTLLGSLFSALNIHAQRKGQAIRSNQYFLILAGVFCSLLLATRPTSILYILCLVIYFLIHQRKNIFFFFVGLLTHLPILLWNFHYFNSWLGGYSTFSGFTRLENFGGSFPGILFSPSRGALIYSPILVFALPGCALALRGLRRFQDGAIDRLFIGLFAASLGICFNYFFVGVWWGGWSYGPRFFTDALPAFCFMIAYSIEFLSKNNLSFYWKILINLIFTATFLFSVLTQVLGVAINETAGEWSAIPYGFDLARLWDWQDSPISRHWNALQNQSLAKHINNPQYLSQFDGKILGVQIDRTQAVVKDGMIEVPRSALQSVFYDPLYRQYLTIRPQLFNVGQDVWYGYRSGLNHGIVVVQGKLFSEKNNLVGTSSFYLTEQCQPQAIGSALGTIVIPIPPKSEHSALTYRLVLDLGINGHGIAPKSSYGIILKIVD
jgi:hypothetical protein